MSSGVTVFYWERVYIFNMRGMNPSPIGWKAADFAEGKEHIWAGSLRINSDVNKETGLDKNYIVLEHDPKDGNSGVFAVCEVTKENVEPVADSSRFFVLRISNQNGQMALIGLGFNEKQAAFDFKHELSSLSQKQRMEQSLIDVPKQDYSLKAPITVSLSTKPVVATEKGTASSVLAGTSLVSLEKPSAATGGRRRAAGARATTTTTTTTAAAPSSSAPATSSSSASSLLDFGIDFDAPKPASTPAAATKPTGTDFFSALGGSSAPAPAAAAPIDFLDSFFSPSAAASTTPTTTQPISSPAAAPAPKPAAAPAGKKDPFDFDGNDWSF